MNGDERNFIDSRLTTLETIVKERWDGHDKAYSERWKTMKDSLDAIHKRMMCETHTESMLNLKGNIQRVWVAFIAVVVGGIILGMWMKGIF